MREGGYHHTRGKGLLIVEGYLKGHSFSECSFLNRLPPCELGCEAKPRWMSEAPPEWGRDCSRGVLLLLSAEGLKKDLGPPKGPVLKDLGPFFCGGPGGWEGYDFHFAHLKFVWSCMWRCKQFSKIFKKIRTFSEILFEIFRKVSKTKIFVNFRNVSKCFENGVLPTPTGIFRFFRNP